MNNSENNTHFKIGIIGLGLIGGSFAKAYTENGHIVYGYDADSDVLVFAELSGAIDGVLNLSDLNDYKCDLLLLAINPSDVIKLLEKIAPIIAPDTTVIDCCGIKRAICEKGFALAEEYGFTFLGGHPMAGSHNSGFKHSRLSLFKGASMVIVPPNDDNPDLLDRVDELLKPVGFGELTVSTAENHDAVIAYSSQLPHIVSNAFIKSPSAKEHKGFSAGSYKDLTRVAKLDAGMWSQLCMENRDFLLKELDCFIDSLLEYKKAIADGDIDKLRKLLEDGSRLKTEVG